MKIRIFGTLMVFIILGVLFFIEKDKDIQIPTNTTQIDNDGSEFKGLKIN